MLQVFAFEIVSANEETTLTETVFKSKIEDKLRKYNEGKEEKAKIKVTITKVEYIEEKKLIIYYTKDEIPLKTSIDRI